MLVLTVACFWLWLYFDSLHQRRKAETLFADLKSFPLASADFAEVRDFVLNHGGSAIQEFPPPFPTFGEPILDSQGQVKVPSVWTKPKCTSRDCVFEVWIRPSPLTVTLSYPSEMRLWCAMRRAGIRPWGSYARLEIADGKLERSRASVGGLEDGKSGGCASLIPLVYDLISEVHPAYGDQGYSVGRPHVSGGALEILQVRIVPTPSMPAARAFDVNLRCLTAVWHGCTFSELAPSAWNDYQHELTPHGSQ